MAASNSKNVKIQVLKVNATGIAITPTDASTANPSVILTATTLTAADGDVAVLAADSTGLTTIDGKSFIIGGLVADTSFNLLGSKAALDTSVFAAVTDITVHGAADWLTLCLSSFTINAGSPSTTSTATFCDPTSSVPSAVVESGTIDVGGYIDITSADYQDMLDWDDAGGQRMFRVLLPKNGSMLFEATIGSLSWDIPIDGALGWNASMTLAGKPRHIF